MRVEDIGEERLIEPDRAQRSRPVAHEHLEDLEARPARRPDRGADDFGLYGRHHPGPQRRDGLKAAAIFVPDWKPVQQILDRREADALKIGRPARTNALQVLKRGGQRRRRDGIQC